MLFVAVRLVLCIAAVFAVAKQGMPDRGKMRTDLMRAPGEQFDFCQSKAVLFGENTVFCADLFAVRAGRFQDFNLIMLCVFAQKPL